MNLPALKLPRETAEGFLGIRPLPRIKWSGDAKKI
jgi:hypothetical protein